MEPSHILPLLLGLAWLLPLASFGLIVLFGPWMGRGGRYAGYLATAAIGIACLLSLVALGDWLACHPLSHSVAAAEHGPAAGGTVAPVSGQWFVLAQFGALRLSIGYYIDALTVAMFVMVTFIATCIHVYSYGYMHEELHEVTDALALKSDGQPVKRRGRFHRFYQYLSLFCFSMLGLVVAGNILMVFLFWELVGICSYFLIGFYIERRSASNAANKAFIVNRVGDFGMLVGLMAVWTGLGTFSFDDVRDAAGRVTEAGIFSQVRPAAHEHALMAPTVPDGMVKQAARAEIDEIVRQSPSDEAAARQIAAKLPAWRTLGYGYWLLVIAGLGIFCGCVGKSAQFPLHVWLPDAMEGPTPVSALIHAATMVAAGVYLVGRFYPVFVPEVLLVIAYTGCITLFIAATIAITATDIKRVLAYSTVSQLGYMMLALGAGGWAAGLFHLFTHAFFKALLFLGSGSVIHATGTNEMPRMGGLWKKMPWTAATMLVGCLAIAGACIPLVVGLSGYYSKDRMISQLLSLKVHSPIHGWLFYVAAAGAGITAFYMFRLWYLTFAGQPRDAHVYQHAHESPKVMYVPLVVLAVMAAISGGRLGSFSLPNLLEQAHPVATDHNIGGGLLLPALVIPAEELSHDAEIHVPVTFITFAVALVGFILATAFYGVKSDDPEDARRRFSPIYSFLYHKWWFDELYQLAFVRPVMYVSQLVAELDRKGIDGLADGLARWTTAVSLADDWIDRIFVDGLVNLIARWSYGVGLGLRNVQTGNLRQYVMFIVVGTVALFVLVSLYWNFAFANP
jgi:NADH-quinone oxidoreductase subunit L